MARTDRTKQPPSPKQVAWRKTFGQRWGGRMRELVQAEREGRHARTD